MYLNGSNGHAVHKILTALITAAIVWIFSEVYDLQAEVVAEKRAREVQDHHTAQTLAEIKETLKVLVNREYDELKFERDRYRATMPYRPEE